MPGKHMNKGKKLLKEPSSHWSGRNHGQKEPKYAVGHQQAEGETLQKWWSEERVRLYKPSAQKSGNLPVTGNLRKQGDRFLSLRYLSRQC